MLKSEYEKLLSEVAKLEDPADGYGVTCEKMFDLDDKPEENIDYILYLSTREYYKNPDESKVFSNNDAMPCKEVHDWLEELIDKIPITEG